MPEQLSKDVTELPAGRELDALIAEKVMGWGKATHFPGGGDEYVLAGERDALGDVTLPRFSADIAAAWEIPNIRRVLAPGKYRAHGHHATLWHAYCGGADEYGEDIWEDAYGETAPLAICRQQYTSRTKRDYVFGGCDPGGAL